MGVQSAATTGASRNRIGACTRGPASWADLAVRVDRGRNLLVPLLVGAASRPACLTGVCPRMGVPGERMTEESYATLSRNQLPAKFKAERRFRGRCIGSREGFFWF